VQAAFHPLPQQQRELLLSLGPKWASDINAHRDLVLQTYSAFHAQKSKEGIQVVRDLAYGAHDRHRLDVFTGSEFQPGEGRPVLLFVHGGAFVRGKRSPTGEVYDNVCYRFARQGYVTVNMEYRLASDAPYPGGAEDVAAAHAWIVRHAAAYGGDPHKAFLMGHSAGGSHVAAVAFDPSCRRDASIAGVILVSARLRADVLPDNPNAAGVRAYYGEDLHLYEQRSVVSHAHRSDVPLFIAIAEYENPYLDAYGAEFFARAAMVRKKAPRFIQVNGHNHTSIVAHINSGEDDLAQEIIHFIEETDK
jgi:acetyl esterase